MLGEAALGTTLILPTPTPPPPLTFRLASPSEVGALPPAFPPITTGEPAAFPQTHSMFFALVCPICESDGVVRVRPSATVLGLDLVRRIPRGEPIAGASFGRRLFLLLNCRVQTCEGGAAERADLLQSDDEGETWRAAGSRAGAYILIGVDAEGVPLVRAQDGSLYRWGSLASVPPPAGASVIAEAGGWWSATTGEYFGLDGRRRFELRSLDPRTPQRAVVAVIPGPDGRLAVWWSAGEPTNLYLSIVGRSGSVDSTWAAHFRPVAWLDASRLLGMVMWVGTGTGSQENLFIPAIMDTRTGTVSAIPEPFTQPQFLGPGDLMLMFGVVPR